MLARPPAACLSSIAVQPSTRPLHLPAPRGEQPSGASLDGAVEHANKFLAPLGARRASAVRQAPDHASGNTGEIPLYAVDRHADAAQYRANRIDLPDPDLGHKDALGPQQTGQIRANGTEGLQAVDATIEGTPGIIVANRARQ